MKLPQHIDAYVHSFLPKMNGWCPPDKAISLVTNILNGRPSVCVEIGVFAGRSLLAIALALRELGQGHVYGIDPWDPAASREGWPEGDPNNKWWSLDHSPIMRECQHYIELLGVSDYVTLIRRTSEAALPQIREAAPLDFLHIDGNHSHEIACFDVEHYVPLVRAGGSVWFDDVDWDSTASAQLKLAELCSPVVRVGNCEWYRRNDESGPRS